MRMITKQPISATTRISVVYVISMEFLGSLLRRLFREWSEREEAAVFSGHMLRLLQGLPAGNRTRVLWITRPVLIIIGLYLGVERTVLETICSLVYDTNIKCVIWLI